MSFADPVAVRHALEMLSELAARDPYAVAMSLGYFMLITFNISFGLDIVRTCHLKIS